MGEAAVLGIFDKTKESLPPAFMTGSVEAPTS